MGNWGLGIGNWRLGINLLVLLVSHAPFPMPYDRIVTEEIDLVSPLEFQLRRAASTN